MGILKQDETLTTRLKVNVELVEFTLSNSRSTFFAIFLGGGSVAGSPPTAANLDTKKALFQSPHSNNLDTTTV